MLSWGGALADLIAAFKDAVAAEGDATAIVEGNGRNVSFNELWQRAEGFAATLANKGIQKGDRALVAMPVGADLYAALAGLWMRGAVAVLPEPALGLKGLRHAVQVTRPKIAITAGAYRLLRLLPELWHMTTARPGDTGQFEPLSCASDDPALMSFTSGSTGTPKCIVRTHGFLMAQRDAVAPLLTAKGTRDLVAFPVFVLVALADGRTSILPNWNLSGQTNLSGSALRSWIEETQAARALLPPVLCERLAETGVPECLSDVFTGGGPVFPDVMQRLAGNCRFTAVYGSTEAEPITHVSAHDISQTDMLAMRSGDGLLVGKPVAQIDVRVVDDEIWVAGAHVNQSYLDPAHEAGNKVHAEGRIWHRTGDAGRLDEHGRLWLLGRHKARVLFKDNWLYPFQIEVAARCWTGVRRAALVEVSSETLLAVEADTVSDWPVPDGIKVKLVQKIPMDRRHRSKVDLNALKHELQR